MMNTRKKSLKIFLHWFKNLNFLLRNLTLILAAFDVGVFGVHWNTRWHISDCDVPETNMFGEKLVDPKPESWFEELFRRIRKKPKFENLLVEPRIERYERGIGLKGLETTLETNQAA